MSHVRRIGALLFVLGLVGLVGDRAAAHPMRFGLLEIVETGPGVFDVGFRFSGREGATRGGEPIVPAHCVPLGARRTTPVVDGLVAHFTVDCGARGLVGAVGARGLDESSSQTLLTLRRMDGSEERRMLDALSPTVDMSAVGAVGALPPGDVFRSYAALGVEHILFGFDHLLFVLGLLLLVSGARRLFATITAFTLGHSVTLALATLGLVSVPSAAIEACIALSILALAFELTRPYDSLSMMRQRPWAVASAFGLLHGLGFAGALSELGLPAGEIPMALFSFNVGVETGQLFFVLFVLALVRLRRRLALPDLSRRVVPYLIGSLSAYWCIERVAAFWS